MSTRTRLDPVRLEELRRHELTSAMHRYEEDSANLAFLQAQDQGLPGFETLEAYRHGKAEGRTKGIRKHEESVFVYIFRSGTNVVWDADGHVAEINFDPPHFDDFKVENEHAEEYHQLIESEPREPVETDFVQSVATPGSLAKLLPGWEERHEKKKVLAARKSKEAYARAHEQWRRRHEQWQTKVESLRGPFEELDAATEAVNASLDTVKAGWTAGDPDGIAAALALILTHTSYGCGDFEPEVEVALDADAAEAVIMYRLPGPEVVYTPDCVRYEPGLLDFSDEERAFVVLPKRQPKSRNFSWRTGGQSHCAASVRSSRPPRKRMSSRWFSTATTEPSTPPQGT